jgi:hypothetical protein
MTTMNVHSQVMDDFSDGDFSNNPSWNGNFSNKVIRPYRETEIGNMKVSDIRTTTSDIPYDGRSSILQPLTPSDYSRIF